MKQIYTTCIATAKSGKQVQAIGNNIQNRRKVGDSDTISAVGATFFDDYLIPDLTYDEGIILCEVQMEKEPFEGSVKAWIYGADKCARVSSVEPKVSRKRCKDGNRHVWAAGDWWLTIWCGKDFFPEREGNVMPIYIKATRTDEKLESD